MESSFHIYHLLSNTNPAPQIRIPKTVISGFGFPEVFYIDYSHRLSFKALSHSKISLVLSSLFYSYTLLLKNTTGASIVHSIPKSISDDTVIQVFIEGQKFIAGWKYAEGYLNKYFPSDILVQFEQLKAMLIDVLLKKYRLRLVHLEAEFIINERSIAYFIAVTNYNLTHLRDRVVSMQLPNINFLVDLSQNFLLRTQTPRAPSLKSETNQNKKEDNIEGKLSKMMKNYESTKYIRFNQLKSALNQDVKLLSNEILYGKRLAKISDQLLLKSTKTAKELRNLSSLLKQKLIQENPNWVDEDSNSRKSQYTQNFRILTKKRLVVKENPQDIVNKILSSASISLDKLKKKVNQS